MELYDELPQNIIHNKLKKTQYTTFNDKADSMFWHF